MGSCLHTMATGRWLKSFWESKTCELARGNQCGTGNCAAALNKTYYALSVQ